MSGTDKKSVGGDRAGGAEVGLGGFIARLTVRTIVLFLVFFSLAAAVAGCLFPKTYMNMYRSLGLYGKAAVYAADALSRERGSHSGDCSDGQCEYASLLSSAIDCAAIAADDDASHNGRLYAFADEYLSLSCHTAYSATADVIYMSGMGSNYAALSYVYGYDDYVRGVRISAMCALGGEYLSSASAEITALLAADARTYDLDMLTAYASSESARDGGYAAFAPDGTYETLTLRFYELYMIADGTDDGSAEGKALKASLLRRAYALASAMADAEENIAASDGFFTQAETYAGDAYTAYVTSL